MIRSDLAWALSSVIPHAGKSETTAVVGLERYGRTLYAWATDRYTFGVARIDSTADLDLRFAPREATELMRYVRPTRVGEQAQELVIGVAPGEFHVGLTDEDDNLADSAVFETITHVLSVRILLDAIDRLNKAETEWDECIFQPPIVAKFAKAQRTELDRLRIVPRRLDNMHGAAVVTVGTHFIGAVAGLTYDGLGPETVTDLLTEGAA